MEIAKKLWNDVRVTLPLCALVGFGMGFFVHEYVHFFIGLVVVFGNMALSIILDRDVLRSYNVLSFACASAMFMIFFGNG